MSRNQFDLLTNDSLVNDFEKTITSHKQSSIFRSAGSSTTREEKRSRKRRATFEIIYDIEYLWFIVLEFLPLKDLLRTSLTNSFTHRLVHSFNCYGEILKRDFFSKNEMDKKDLGNIVKNIDNTGVFVYLIGKEHLTSKFTPQKLEAIKHTVEQEPDYKYKKIFGKIHQSIENEIEEKKSEKEALSQHVRKFLIEKIRDKSTQNMRTKVKECAHNHCEIREINSPPFTFVLECLDCKVAALTNFRPETVFKKETMIRYSRNQKAKTSLNLEKYVLNTNVHFFEFDRATMYY